MTTTANIGIGTTYQINDPDQSPAALVTLGEVVDISGGSDDTGLIDATHMASTGNRREYIGGLIDGGEITVELNFKPNNTTHQLLVARQTARDSQQHKITFPDGETLTVNALVTAVSWNDPVADKMSLSFTAKKTGAETWAAS